MSATAFWRDFAEEADALANEMQRGNQRKVLDAIDRLLNFHGFDFCFDISSDENSCLLIFSPEGIDADGLQIDQFLTGAPSSTHWKFLGRRQKKNLNDVSAIIRGLYVFDPLELRYRFRREMNIGIIEMIVPANADLSAEESIGMINTFLWHSIGEGRVMELGIRGKVLFDDLPAGPTLSAAELMEIFG